MFQRPIKSSSLWGNFLDLKWWSLPWMFMKCHKIPVSSILSREESMWNFSNAVSKHSSPFLIIHVLQLLLAFRILFTHFCLCQNKYFECIVMILRNASSSYQALSKNKCVEKAAKGNKLCDFPGADPFTLFYSFTIFSQMSFHPTG